MEYIILQYTTQLYSKYYKGLRENTVWITVFYNNTGRDADADKGGRWFESLIFIIKQGAGKRQVVDRQKIINQVRVQEVQSGRQAQCQGRLNGQAGGLSVRAGKGQNRED